MAWLYLGGIACWTLACAALLAAFSPFDLAWVLLIVAGVLASVGWLGLGGVITVRRRWSRGWLRLWGAWPLAVALVWLLDATHLPLDLRVIVSRGALTGFAEAARESRPRRGRAGLVVVLDSEVRGECVFLTCGSGAGLVHVPEGVEPPGYWRERHIAGPWWYFENRS